MTRCKLSIAVLITGILLTLALPAAAGDFDKQPQLAFRLGGGSAYVSDLEEWENGIGGGMSFLVPAGKHWKIIGETSFWNILSDDDPKPTRYIFYIGPGVDYVTGRQSFFLGGSVGFGSLTYDYTDADGTRKRLDQGGFGFNLHTGFFFKLGDKLGIGPRIDYTYVDIGNQQTFGYLSDYKVAPYWWILSLAVQFP